MSETTSRCSTAPSPSGRERAAAAPGALADATGAAARDDPRPDTAGPDPKKAGAAFLRLVPRDFARRHLLLSQGCRQGTERLAVAEGTTDAAIFNAGVRLGVPVHATAAPAEALARAIDAAYAAWHESGPVDPADASADEAPDIDRLLAAADRDLLTTEGKGPVVRLVDALLFEALGRGASDVHIQPQADGALVRYRLDGVLHTARTLPRSVVPAVISRVKVMGRMDIAEHRVPQDGRASVAIGDAAGGGRSIELRLSTLPTRHGERVVIRLLVDDAQRCDFGKLGLPSDLAPRYLDRAGRASGIILLTGPTGSGKTTTLYATLRRLGAERRADTLNIMTIEDPIEYDLSAAGLVASQAQVNERRGLSFATGLRHILRQDPDVIMIGEIRDADTARIAIQSSLTGHQVFSTLHTNDAAGAITRLLDLGIEPYLVAASLSAVMAQRLVRLRHAACRGAGCATCFRTGFLERRGLFELLVVDETMRGLIAAGTPLAELRRAARAAGMRSLEDQGERLVRRGLTTRAEVRRCVEDLA